MGTVNEGLGQIDLAAIPKVLCQRPKNLPKGALLDPLLHAAMAGLIGRIFARQRLPSGASPEDPEDPVQDPASGDTRPSLAVTPAFDLRDQRLDDRPLFIG